MIRKLRVKFILVIMLIVALFLITILGTAIYSAKQNFERQSISMMERVDADPFIAYAPGRHNETPRTNLPYFVITLDPFGRYIVTEAEYFDLSDESLVEELYTTVSSLDKQSGILADYELRFLVRSDSFTTSIVFADMSAENASVTALAKTSVVLFLAAMLVFFGISWLLSYWVIRPVEKAWLQQKQFVADASHELKTPLTVIMTNAELMNSPEYDDVSRQKLSGNILTVSEQMRGLVESLLELARADNGTAKTVLSKLDFSKLTEEALLPFEPLFFEADERILESEITPGITLTGDASHLRQIVEILVDNARKYSHPGTVTTVSLTKHPRSCELTVSDFGEAISEADLKHIFERFYRVDKARTMSHSYGLGLSIAQCFTEEHKGKIWAESKDGINSFHVVLPL